MENRKIRFRIWIPEARRVYSDDGMYYQEDQYLSSFLRRVYDQFAINHPSYLPFQVEERLMQDTGLKDKNGKHIYEGDIVKWEGYVSYVKYEPTLGQLYGPGFYLADKNGETWGVMEKLNNKQPDRTRYEVIGNIYQNKELLKK